MVSEVFPAITSGGAELRSAVRTSLASEHLRPGHNHARINWSSANTSLRNTSSQAKVHLANGKSSTTTRRIAIVVGQRMLSYTTTVTKL